MSWSYRSDRSDEVYTANQGPAVVSGVKQSDTPSAASPEQIKYTADGAIAPTSHTAILAKTSAGAFTLAAPAQDGETIRLICGTAFAHVVTATGLIDDGVTGGAKNTITMGAFVGAAATIRSYGGHWVLLSKTVATVA